MANSVAVANLEVQVQDALQSGIPPVVFRTVPPVTYQSGQSLIYSNYTQLNAGSSEILTQSLDWSFLYIRNTGPGVLVVTLSTVQTPSGPSTFYLAPGGFFCWANNSSNVLPQNGVIGEVTIAPLNTVPVVVEWMLAQ